MLDRIAAAADLAALEAVRVAALGKSGEITALLKSLGAMDAETRAAEAPKIHALREAVTDAHRRRARRRSRRPSSSARLATETARPVAAGAGKRRRARSIRSAR